MLKRFCHTCRQIKPNDQFWQRHHHCIDCTREGKRKGLSKGGNVRLMVRIPEDLNKELRKVAEQREVTLSVAVSDLLRAAL